MTAFENVDISHPSDTQQLMKQSFMRSQVLPELSQNTQLSHLLQDIAPSALVRLFDLSFHATIMFDATGTIRMANAQAEQMFYIPSHNLLSCDIRDIFFPTPLHDAYLSDEYDEDNEFSVRELPFVAEALDPANTASCTIVCPDAEGKPQRVRIVACLLTKRNFAHPEDEIYLMVAKPQDLTTQKLANYTQLTEELSRANRRLSGTLKIVLGVLDTQDIDSLCARVLDLLSDTMEADGCLCYIKQGDGFYLRGASATLTHTNPIHFIPLASTICARALESPVAQRVRILGARNTQEASAKDALSAHDIHTRDTLQIEILDEETHEMYVVPSAQVPKFESYMSAVVRYDEEPIALLQVGWQRPHTSCREDAELLDSVAQYLSVQMASAIAAAHAQKEHQLFDAAASICAHFERERELGITGLKRTAATLAQLLSAELIPIYTPDVSQVPESEASAEPDTQAFCNSHSDAISYLIDLPKEKGCIFTPKLGLLRAAQRHGINVAVFSALDEVGRFLDAHHVGSRGAMLELTTSQHVSFIFLLVRSCISPQFDRAELSFLRNITQDIKTYPKKREAKTQEARIAQALQTGMKNELQQVRGITAQGIYSSATEAATIGGDFYDLVRLPEGKACVVMGDVSGKGVEAASVSAAVKTALAAYSWQGLSPAEMTRLLNEFLLGFSRLETFATLFVGIIDLAHAHLTYCSAGHPPALLMHAHMHDIIPLQVQSGVVGAFHEMSYQNGEIRLSEGDMLLLYTDGTTEARAQNGNFFGEDGLLDALIQEKQHGFEGILDRLLARLDTFTSQHLDDDVAMVCLRFDDVHQSKDL